jgi:hypothetical protein
MIYVDIRNYLVSDDVFKNISIDGRPDFLYSQAIAKAIRSESHTVIIREKLCNVHERVNWLLGEKLNLKSSDLTSSISVSLCTELTTNPTCGFKVRHPKNPSERDLLLSLCVKEYLSDLIGITDLTDYSDDSGSQVIPPRADDNKPARVEICLPMINEQDSMFPYWLRASQMERFGLQLSRAFEKYTDVMYNKNLNVLELVEEQLEIKKGTKPKKRVTFSTL